MGGSMQTHSAQHGDFGRADANSRAKWDLHPSDIGLRARGPQGQG